MQTSDGKIMIQGMESLHINEGDWRPAEPVRRKMSECLALMDADSTATIDAEFAEDVEMVIASHREPLEPPVWD